jgi:hypothetical protein
MMLHSLSESLSALCTKSSMSRWLTTKLEALRLSFFQSLTAGLSPSFVVSRSRREATARLHYARLLVLIFWVVSSNKTAFLSLTSMP